MLCFMNNIKNYLVLNHPLISQLSLLKKFLVIFIQVIHTLFILIFILKIRKKLSFVIFLISSLALVSLDLSQLHMVLQESWEKMGILQHSRIRVPSSLQHLQIFPVYMCPVMRIQRFHHLLITMGGASQVAQW